MLSSLLPQLYWGYKIQFPFQAKIIWPCFEFWGLIHSRSRVDLELFSKKNPGWPVGPSHPSWQVRGLVRFPRVLSWTSFCLTRVCLQQRVDLSSLSSTELLHWAFSEDKNSSCQAVVKVKWRVITLFILYSLGLKCTELDCDPCFMM